MSHHFRILRDAGVISTVIEGTAHINTLRLDELDRIFPRVMSSILAVQRGAAKVSLR